jgi:hypothetical protein
MATVIEHEDLWEDAKDLGDDLIEAGADPDQTAKAIATFLDRLVPLDLLIPGVPGMALEAVDGPALERVVRALIDLLRADPERRALRRSARTSRRASRQTRRAARRAERQGE